MTTPLVITSAENLSPFFFPFFFQFYHLKCGPTDIMQLIKRQILFLLLLLLHNVSCLLMMHMYDRRYNSLVVNCHLDIGDSDGLWG